MSGDSFIEEDVPLVGLARVAALEPDGSFSFEVWKTRKAIVPCNIQWLITGEKCREMMQSLLFSNDLFDQIDNVNRLELRAKCNPKFEDALSLEDTSYRFGEDGRMEARFACLPEYFEYYEIDISDGFEVPMTIQPDRYH